MFGKSAQSNRGFTLIELLVAISIIAILAIIALVSYQGIQKNARDARRKADIDAIAKALEAKKTINSGSYNVLAASDFATGSIPTEPAPTTEKYCVAVGAAVPAVPAAWTGSACPAGWNEVSATNPAAASISWRVCTLLEETAGVNRVVYCRANAQ